MCSLTNFSGNASKVSVETEHGSTARNGPKGLVFEGKEEQQPQRHQEQATENDDGHPHLALSAGGVGRRVINNVHGGLELRRPSIVPRGLTQRGLDNEAWAESGAGTAGLPSRKEVEGADSGAPKGGSGPANARMFSTIRVYSPGRDCWMGPAKSILLATTVPPGQAALSASRRAAWPQNRRAQAAETIRMATTVPPGPVALSEPQRVCVAPKPSGAGGGEINGDLASGAGRGGDGSTRFSGGTGGAGTWRVGFSDSLETNGVGSGEGGVACPTPALGFTSLGILEVPVGGFVASLARESATSFARIGDFTSAGIGCGFSFTACPATHRLPPGAISW